MTSSPFLTKKDTPSFRILLSCKQHQKWFIKLLIPISLLERIWLIHPSGLLHVGAHLGEESGDYEKYGWGEKFGIYWIEGQKDLVEKLQKRFSGSKNKVYEGVVWDVSGETLNFKISNNSQSSSVFDFGSHSEDYPDVVFESERSVTTVTISDLLPADAQFDFINLDIQGAELNALKGLGARLQSVNWIYSEVNSKEVYKGCATINMLDEFLTENGFIRVATVWVKDAGWGDALYIRKSTAGGQLSIFRKALETRLTLELLKIIRRGKKLLKVILDQLRS